MLHGPWLGAGEDWELLVRSGGQNPRARARGESKVIAVSGGAAAVKPTAESGVLPSPVGSLRPAASLL